MTNTEILLIGLGFLLVIISTLLRIKTHYNRYKKARDFMQESVTDLEKKIQTYHSQFPNKDAEMEKARQDHYEYFMKEREALKNQDKEGFDPSQN